MNKEYFSDESAKSYELALKTLVVEITTVAARRPAILCYTTYKMGA